MTEMPPLVDRLFGCLNTGNVQYCLWKNSHEVTQSARGEEDFDLLIRRSQFTLFQGLVSNLGFREAKSKYSSHPFTYHFYGYDESYDVILHLHVYTRLITGESHSKNFHLPFERELLRSARSGLNGYRVPGGWEQFVVFLVRYYIKVSCLPGMYLLLKRCRNISDEYKHIKGEIPEDDRRLEVLLKDWGITKKIFLSMKNGFDGPGPSVAKMLTGQRVRFSFWRWRRYGVFEGVLVRYFQIAYRMINKIAFGYKKRFENGGIIVAVTGTDGAGKTTVSDSLKEWLARHFDVRRFHMGRPPSALLTVPHRIAWGLWKSSIGNREKRSYTRKASGGSIPMALHYVCIAWERARLGRRIQRLRNKGFVVICDRYKSESLGRMDGPRINAWRKKSGVIRVLGGWEQRLYRQIPKADLAVDLVVSLRVAIERNRLRGRDKRESDDKIKARHKERKEVRYAADLIDKINAGGSLSGTVQLAKKSLWNAL